MRKVLYSPGWGAGWSSWASPEEAKFAIDYQPIIDFLESGGKFEENGHSAIRENKPQYEDFNEPGRSVLKQFYSDLAAHLGKPEDDVHFYLGGAEDLTVAEVDGPVRVHDYDGNESLEEPGQYNNWL